MALKPGGPPLPGDGSGDRHMPGGRRPLGPANGGVTEDWGKVILRIKEDLVPVKIPSGTSPSSVSRWGIVGVPM